VSVEIGSERLLATPGHPFWADGEGWVAAADLGEGARLLTLGGAAGARIGAAPLALRDPTTVFNLEVAGTHTYLVGEAGVLVHNRGDGCAASGGSGRRPREKPDPNATGEHTTFRRDKGTGKVDHYETWKDPHPKNKGQKWESERRFDGKGRGHRNSVTGDDVATPHVHDRSTPGGVRPAEPWEIPRR